MFVEGRLLIYVYPLKVKEGIFKQTDLLLVAVNDVIVWE